MTAQLACMTDDLGPEEAMLVELDGADGAPVAVAVLPAPEAVAVLLSPVAVAVLS